ncbi:MAG: tRNA (cytidine(34)-2'-O)-methyltransferase [Desulfobacterales bacterium]
MTDSDFFYPNKSWERHVVLVYPEVHWNTGNIGRTCLGAGAYLHLIRPLGFSLDHKHLKRAGLDYWAKVRLYVWENFSMFLEKMNPLQNQMALYSKNGGRSLWSMKPSDRLFLVFGSETRGLPLYIIKRYPEATYHIPISKEIRSLNLSTAAAIALYESLRPLNPENEWTSDLRFAPQ